MERQRLEHLLDRYFDQGLSVPELEELEQTLRESSPARETFWEFARMHALLRNWAQGEWGSRTAAPVPKLRALPPPPVRVAMPRRVVARPPTVVKPPTWPRWAMAAAAVLVAGGLGWLALNPREPAGPAPAIAVLTRAAGVVWEPGPAAPPLIGQDLRPGTLRLRSGALQVEFTRGARVVLEGPAEFRLVSDNEGFLQHGKLAAFVPGPAHGFKVNTPGFAAVDHGTEFGCVVPLTGPAEVHVFTGEVNVRPAGEAAADRPLHQTQALRIGGKQVEAIPAVRQAFLGEEELAQLIAADGRDRLAAWRVSSRALAAHPGAVVHLDFEPTNAWERTLRNRARNAPPNSAAAVIGCEPAEGRWPGKRALRFKGDGDRLRLTVPATFPSVTLMAWVSVDALPNFQNALLMNESFQPGELHWYLYLGGKIGLGVGGGTQRGWEIFQSEPVVSPAKFGSWIFLASVYDGPSRTVTHYLDGQPVASGTLKGNPAAPRLDTFEIGNYGVRLDDPRSLSREARLPGRSSRGFQGRMDEFTVLSTPLKPAEIRALYAAGQPGERS